MEGWPDLAGDCFFVSKVLYQGGSARRAPKGARSVPRASQDLPKVAQEAPKPPRKPQTFWNAPERSQAGPGGPLEGHSKVARRLPQGCSKFARWSLEGRSKVARRSPEGFTKVGAIQMIKPNFRPSSCTISQLCLQCSCSTFPACIYTACFHIQKSTQKFDADHRGRALVSPNVILQLITR